MRLQFSNTDKNTYCMYTKYDEISRLTSTAYTNLNYQQIQNANYQNAIMATLYHVQSDDHLRHMRSISYLFHKRHSLISLVLPVQGFHLPLPAAVAAALLGTELAPPVCCADWFC